MDLEGKLTLIKACWHICTMKISACFHIRPVRRGFWFSRQCFLLLLIDGLVNCCSIRKVQNNKFNLAITNSLCQSAPQVNELCLGTYVTSTTSCSRENECPHRDTDFYARIFNLAFRDYRPICQVKKTLLSLKWTIFVFYLSSHREIYFQSVTTYHI